MSWNYHVLYISIPLTYHEYSWIWFIPCAGAFDKKSPPWLALPRDAKDVKGSRCWAQSLSHLKLQTWGSKMSRWKYLCWILLMGLGLIGWNELKQNIVRYLDLLSNSWIIRVQMVAPWRPNVSTGVHHPTLATLSRTTAIPRSCAPTCLYERVPWTIKVMQQKIPGKLKGKNGRNFGKICREMESI